MALLTTNITDAYEPAPWAQHFTEINVSQLQLIKAGIMAMDPEVSAVVKGADMAGGRTFDMPFWNDLPHDLAASSRSSVATDTDDEITPSGIDYGQDIGVKHYRTKAWNASPLVSHVAGSDPIQVFIGRYSNWWQREIQRLLLKTLKGCFATTLSATHVNDISTEDGDNATDDNKISVNAIEDTRFLLGDAYNKLTGMIMHSTVMKKMRLNNLIDVVPDSAQQLEIPVYNGLRVFVDDDMTTTDGSTSGTKYDTYLFGQGAIAFIPLDLNPAIDPAFEIYREPMKGTGAGSVNVITRMPFVLHPRGVAWQLTPSSVDYPTDTELETGTSWSKVWLTKNVRLAKLVTNG